jgi:hypothetical protein
MKRLETAARAIGLAVPGGFERVHDAARETTRAWGPREGYLRLVVTRGVGALGIDPSTCLEPAIVCIATGAAPLSPEKAARGLDLVTSSLRRPPADVLDPRVKSLNYLNNVLAKREATLRGADDALVLNARGLIAESSATNVFALTGRILDTPPTTDGALEGLTRRTVMELGRAGRCASGASGFDLCRRRSSDGDAPASCRSARSTARPFRRPVGRRARARRLSISARSSSRRPSLNQTGVLGMCWPRRYRPHRCLWRKEGRSRALVGAFIPTLRDDPRCRGRLHKL